MIDDAAAAAAADDDDDLSSWDERSIKLTPYMVLPPFATRFADYAGGIRVSFIQHRLF